MTDWKIIERIEQITDHLESLHNFIIKSSELHKITGDWITEANENMNRMEKEIAFLKNKKTCV